MTHTLSTLRAGAAALLFGASVLTAAAQPMPATIDEPVTIRLLLGLAAVLAGIQLASRARRGEAVGSARDEWRPSPLPDAPRRSSFCG